MTTSLKSVNIWQNYKQERGCLIHCARLAYTLLKDEEGSVGFVIPIKLQIYKEIFQ